MDDDFMRPIEYVQGFFKNNAPLLNLYAQTDPQGMEELDILIIGILGNQVIPFLP